MRFSEVGGCGGSSEPKFIKEHAELIRDHLQPGDRVLAEIYIPRITNGGSDGKNEVVLVTIQKKHKYIAETDRGDVSWVNVLLHNEVILRRIQA